MVRIYQLSIVMTGEWFIIVIPTLYGEYMGIKWDQTDQTGNGYGGDMI